MNTANEILHAIAADTGGEVIRQWNGRTDDAVRVGVRVAALSTDDRDEEGHEVDSNGMFLWTGWIDEDGRPETVTDTHHGGADEVRAAIVAWLRA